MSTSAPIGSVPGLGLGLTLVLKMPPETPPLTQTVALTVGTHPPLPLILTRILNLYPDLPLPF